MTELRQRRSGVDVPTVDDELQPHVRPRATPRPSWRQLSSTALQRSAGRLRSLLRADARVDPPSAPVASRPTPTSGGRRGFVVSVLPTTRIVLLDGELDLAAVEPLATATAPLTVGRGGDVVVDLSMLCFVDAAGLGALVTLRNLLARRGNRLLLCHATPRTIAVFDVAGLSDLLTES